MNLPYVDDFVRLFAAKRETLLEELGVTPENSREFTLVDSPRSQSGRITQKVLHKDAVVGIITVIYDANKFSIFAERNRNEPSQETSEATEESPRHRSPARQPFGQYSD